MMLSPKYAGIFTLRKMCPSKTDKKFWLVPYTRNISVSFCYHDNQKVKWLRSNSTSTAPHSKHDTYVWNSFKLSATTSLVVCNHWLLGQVGGSFLFWQCNTASWIVGKMRSGVTGSVKNCSVLRSDRRVPAKHKNKPKVLLKCYIKILKLNSTCPYYSPIDMHILGSPLGGDVYHKNIIKVQEL